MEKEPTTEVPRQSDEVLTDLLMLRDLNNRRANISLTGLALTFCLSLTFFLFSGELGRSTTDSIDTREREESIESELAKLTPEIGKVLTQINEGTRAAGPAESSTAKELPSTSIEILKQQDQNLNRQKTALLKELDTLQSRRLAELQLKTESQSIENIIATSITRIGAVLLAIFMMQILLGFYRYFIRLNNFYGTKVILVKSLAHSDAEALRTIVESLLPEGIDFGKEPTMPFDKVVDLIKSIK